jgi:hypothetical protein
MEISRMEEKQSAEERAGSLEEQLAEANQKIAQMSRDLNALDVERRLTRKLVAAGVTDLEAAVLIARARMEGKDKADLDGCVEQLRKEKSYLFGGSETAVSRKTAGARERVTHSHTTLEQAAKKAARTGSRVDLQHYLKLRRNLL